MSDLIYDLKGSSGRNIQVYDDKVILSIKAGIANFLTGNFWDGEKTIYYADCTGVQFKKGNGFQIGYLQFETAGVIMNKGAGNVHNENTFIWESTSMNKTMEEVANYTKERVAYYKQVRNTPAATSTPADEIKKFKELLDMGVISQEEFDAKKKQLLGL